MSDSSLNDRLEEWLTEEASEATADLFGAHLRPALRELGFSPTGPCTDEEWAVIREQLEGLLGRAGVDLQLMEQAAEETKRARSRDWSLRQWLQNAYRRLLPDELASERAEIAEQLIEAVDGANDLDAPPQPEDVLAYWRLLNAVGGGVGLAGAVEQARRQTGGLPTN